MKKHRYNLTRLVFVIILTTFWIIAYDRPKDVFSKETTDDNRETDRLFQDMDILTPPHITSPIEISLMDLNGKKISLSDFRGKIVFLNFWATWCIPCRLEMVSMEKLHTRLKDKDFIMMAIDLMEPTRRVKKFFTEKKLTFISLLDKRGKVGSKYSVKNLPTTFIMDREGRIIGQAIGPREWDSKNSIALFERLIDAGADTSP